MTNPLTIAHIRPNAKTKGHTKEEVAAFADMLVKKWRGKKKKNNRA